MMATSYWAFCMCQAMYTCIIKLLNNEGSHSLKVKVKSLSHVRLFATPWTVAHQAPPSMGFSRREYLSGLPFSSPGDLPDPGIEPMSPSLQADALISEPPGKPISLPEQESNLGTRHWKHRVLATGPAGKFGGRNHYFHFGDGNAQRGWVSYPKHRLADFHSPGLLHYLTLHPLETI